MKKKIFIFLCFFLVADFCFAYGDMSDAEYAGKDYEMDLDYSISQLKNEWIRVNKRQGYTVYKIEKLTKNETRLIDDALYEYRLEKGDVYTVRIGEISTNPMRVLKIVVRIDRVYNSGRNWDYTWWSIGKTYF